MADQTAAEVDVEMGGRTIRVRDAGEPGWPAVVFFHGMPSAGNWPSLFDNESAAAKVRMISFDRPGYGYSTPARYTLSSLAADVGKLADARGIERFAVLGFTYGGSHALAAAAVLGDRVSAVGLIGAYGPYDEVPGGLDELDDVDRKVRTSMPDEPEAAEASLVECYANWAAFGEDGQAMLAYTIGRGIQQDHITTDPTFQAHQAASFGRAMRQGAAGCVADNMAWIMPWEIDLHAISQPAWLWYDEGDPYTPLNHAHYLHSQLPNSRLVIWQEQSHYGHVRHWPEIVETLTAGLR